MGPRDDLEEGRLAGTVVAEEADDLAGLHGEVDAVQRTDEAVVEVDPGQLEGRDAGALGGHAHTFFWWTDRFATAMRRSETLVWIARSMASEPSSRAPVTTVAQ